MLVGFLEQNAQIRNSLSRSQMFEIETIFLLYLLKVISFRQAATQTDNVLDPDQAHLRIILKQKLSDLIGDADCNTVIKPAVLRLAAGDATGFKAAQASPQRTLQIIKRYKKPIMEQVRKCVFPLNEIGPKHVRKLEAEQLKLIMPHVKSHVYTKARFLTNGDSGLALTDIQHELLLLALRALRSYYPFREGLYLTNTLRNTVTLRGRGFVTAATATCRRRLVMQGDKSVNLESTVEDIDNMSEFSVDPCSLRDLQNGLLQVASKGGVASRIANFLLSPEKQDEFCFWVERIAQVKGEDLADTVKKTGLPYASLLSRYLELPKRDVRYALEKIQSLVV
jgi:hypothetical protein